MIKNIIFIIQGCSCILGFYVYINSSDYFMEMYFESVMSVFSSIFLFFNLIGLLYMIFIGVYCHWFITFILPYCFFVLSLLIVPLLNLLEAPRTVSLVITIIILICSGWATAILEGGVFGKSYLYQGREPQMVMFGIGLIGFLVSNLKVFTKFLRLDNVYFFVSSGFYVFSMLSLILLVLISREEFSKRKEYKKINIKEVWSVFMQIKLNCFWIFLIFFVTMSIFPGISSFIPSSFGLGNWLSIILASIFTTLDFVGRSLPNFYEMNEIWIQRIILLRTNFVILFYLYIRPIWFVHTDVVPMTMMGIMALSNGYTSTIIMKRGQTEENQEVAGNLMTFFMLLGISSGSIFSIILVYLNQGIYIFVTSTKLFI